MTSLTQNWGRAGSGPLGAGKSGKRRRQFVGAGRLTPASCAISARVINAPVSPDLYVSGTSVLPERVPSSLRAPVPFAPRPANSSQRGTRLRMHSLLILLNSNLLDSYFPQLAQ